MLRILIPFCAGVVAGFQAGPEIRLRWLIILLFLLWAAVFAVFRWQREKPVSLPWLVSPILGLLFFVLGAGTGICCRPEDPCLPDDQWVLVRGKIMGKPQEWDLSYAFDMEIHLLFSPDTLRRTSTRIKCYLSVPADSLLPATGQTWQFTGKLASIRNSGNPGSPDYRSIMGRKNIWYRFYISTGKPASNYNREVAVRDRRLDPVLIREQVSAHWQGDGAELALLKAVCLGDRSSLTDDMRQAYAAAGGMHLLAVSGLHIGLIWWVLQYMTGWMHIIFRERKQQTILVVGLLWFYAFITGFSSSVCRSVTMFSFFSASRLMGERLQPLNVILASAFLLVLIEPSRLMEAGFQLSYAAITGIITLHPLAMRVVRVKNRVLRRVWEATSVSIAAQLATAPLVIYYFHQFPVYSILTNLIAVPLLSLLIAIFVCSVPFVSAGILENVSSFLLLTLARLMNLFMEHLSSLPGAVMGALQLNRFSLLLWILILLMSVIALYSKRRVPWYMLSVLIAVFLLGSTLTCLKRRSSSELVIAHIRGASMVTVREGFAVDHFCWYRDSISLEYMKAYMEIAWNRRIYENFTHELRATPGITGVAAVSINLAEGAWLLGGEHFCGLVLRAPLDTFGWDITTCPDFVLLSGEPWMAGLKMKGFLQQTLLVIDGSNRSWYQERIQSGWDQVYLTDRSGAYVKRWKK